MKIKKTPLTKIRELLKQKQGVVLASDLPQLGIPHIYLSILEKRGEIQRVSRGVYTTSETILDEMDVFQSRYKVAIFSHETALYLHGLTDRSPLYYSITLPSGYNATRVKKGGAKVYFIIRTLYLLGLVTLKSEHGNDLRTFDLERSICDILRNRNQMDIQFVNEALKRYVRRKDRNIDLLYGYAMKFRIEKVVRNYIEVLL
jgi:predicted transcriptional regulator of viral defense system